MFPWPTFNATPNEVQLNLLYHCKNDIKILQSEETRYRKLNGSSYALLRVGMKRLVEFIKKDKSMLFSISLIQSTTDFTTENTLFRLFKCCLV